MKVSPGELPPPPRPPVWTPDTELHFLRRGVGRLPGERGPRNKKIARPLRSTNLLELRNFKPNNCCRGPDEWDLLRPGTSADEGGGGGGGSMCKAWHMHSGADLFHGRAKGEVLPVQFRHLSVISCSNTALGGLTGWGGGGAPRCPPSVCVEGSRGGGRGLAQGLGI